jgi:hypothetical protein
MWLHTIGRRRCDAVVRIGVVSPERVRHKAPLSWVVRVNTVACLRFRLTLKMTNGAMTSAAAGAGAVTFSTLNEAAAVILGVGSLSVLLMLPLPPPLALSVFANADAIPKFRSSAMRTDASIVSPCKGSKQTSFTTSLLTFPPPLPLPLPLISRLQLSPTTDDSDDTAGPNLRYEDTAPYSTGRNGFRGISVSLSAATAAAAAAAAAIEEADELLRSRKRIYSVETRFSHSPSS